MGTRSKKSAARPVDGPPLDMVPAFDHLHESGVERNHETMRAWMGHWVMNSVANTRYFDTPNAHSLSEIRGIGKGKPCVIVGAGPSLDDSLDSGAAQVLKDYAAKGAMILCPNSCARPLLARGIEPWAYVAMHPTAEIAASFEARPGVPLNTRGRKLITATAIHPNVSRLWLDHAGAGDVYLTLQMHIENYQMVAGINEAKREAKVADVQSHNLPSDWYGVCQHSIWHHRLHEYRLWPWQRRNVPLPSIPNAGCVVNYAVLVASVLGCSPIVLLGVDYSLTPDADGHLRYKCDDWTVDTDTNAWTRNRRMERDQFTIYSHELHEVSGVNGGKRYTHAYMLGYANSMRVLRNRGAYIDSTDRLDIVNASADGILTGIPRVDLADTLDKACRGAWPKRVDA